MSNAYTREVEDWQTAPVSINDQKLEALAKAFAELCDQFQKDPMRCAAYREAVK